jgi:hypothetical protein
MTMHHAASSAAARNFVSETCSAEKERLPKIIAFPVIGVLGAASWVVVWVILQLIVAWMR